MELAIGDIITLDYKDKYLLLDKLTANNSTYYFSVGLNEEENDIKEDDVVFQKEIIENNNHYLEVVEDADLIEQLYDAFEESQYNRAITMEKIIEDYFKSTDEKIA